jgi:hypothetical protein
VRAPLICRSAIRQFQCPLLALFVFALLVLVLTILLLFF